MTNVQKVLKGILWCINERMANLKKKMAKEKPIVRELLQGTSLKELENLKKLIEKCYKASR